MEGNYTLTQDLLRDPVNFVRQSSELKLRSYQEDVVRAIINSVIEKKGLSFVVIFPRQSGKNELQAQIENYLLTIFSPKNGELVKISPTWKPQSMNAMRRLERALQKNQICNWMVMKEVKEGGYIYRVGSARITFLSGASTSNIVGATASTLLECDEAQDVLISKWDKEINPMAASTNATRVFWGTAWTSRTLLAREKRLALKAEKEDGIRRVWVLTADDVAKEVPAYGKFVAGEIAKLGRNHPFVRSQFFSEEIDEEGRMFPPARVALMKGRHTRIHAPQPGKIYVFTIDVAGEDEGVVKGQGEEETRGQGELANPARDATALTVAEIDFRTLEDDLIRAPTYKVVERRLWVGTKYTDLYGQLWALGECWEPRYIVVDATGVGAGLASWLEKAYPNRVIPYVFNGSTKSKLGWDFLGIVETGRFKDWTRGQGEEATALKNSAWGQGEEGSGRYGQDEQAVFWNQLSYCQMEIVPGPERRMKWGVPDGTRDATNGELVHDDLVISAALCAALEKQEWGLAVSEVLEGGDPLAEMDEVY